MTPLWSWTQACRRRTWIASITFRTSTEKLLNSKKPVSSDQLGLLVNWQHKSRSSFQNWLEQHHTTREIGPTFALSGWRANVSAERSVHTGKICAWWMMQVCLYSITTTSLFYNSASCRILIFFPDTNVQTIQTIRYRSRTFEIVITETTILLLKSWWNGQRKCRRSSRLRIPWSPPSMSQDWLTINQNQSLIRFQKPISETTFTRFVP